MLGRLFGKRERDHVAEVTECVEELSVRVAGFERADRAMFWEYHGPDTFDLWIQVHHQRLRRAAKGSESEAVAASKRMREHAGIQHALQDLPLEEFTTDDPDCLRCLALSCLVSYVARRKGFTYAQEWDTYEQVLKQLGLEPGGLRDAPWGSADDDVG